MSREPLPVPDNSDSYDTQEIDLNSPAQEATPASEQRVPGEIHMMPNGGLEDVPGTMEYEQKHAPKTPGEVHIMKDMGGLEDVPGTMEYEQKKLREELETKARVAELQKRAEEAAQKYKDERAA